jgi:hypothetical protein
MKQRDRFIQLHKELWSNFYYDLGADMKFLDVELERIYQWFQLGEASALERAAVECERLSTAIDNVGKTYKRDTTSTHCALAIRALAQEVGK